MLTKKFYLDDPTHKNTIFVFLQFISTLFYFLKIMIMPQTIDKYIERLKSPIQEDKPFVGWLSGYTPEEVLHAAGLRPYKLTGNKNSIEQSHRYFPTTFSPHASNLLEFAVKGSYNFLEGVVIANYGVSIYRLYDTWSNLVQTPFIRLLDVPKNNSEEAVNYYCKCIRNLVGELTAHFGQTVTDDHLSQAIKDYNETRNLFEQIYRMRRNNHNLISGGETVRLIQAATTASRTTVNAIISDLIDELADSEQFVKNRTNRIPVMVTGDIFDQPSLIDVIDELGGCVVCEDLEEGIHYCRKPVDLNCDPIESISRRYLNKYPTATTIGIERRLDNLMNLIEEFGAKGVVYYTVKFNDSNLYEYPHLRKYLAKKGIPSLFLEVDNILSNMEQIKTRIQAFLEIL